MKFGSALFFIHSEPTMITSYLTPFRFDYYFILITLVYLLRWSAQIDEWVRTSDLLLLQIYFLADAMYLYCLMAQ